MFAVRLFNLGLPKSGTSSLQKVLEALGVPSSHWQVAKAETGSASKLKYVGEVIYSNYLSGRLVFDGFVDTEAITQSDVCLPAQGINLWPQLDSVIRSKIPEQYPECKLILLKRDPSLIVSSIKKWHDMFLRFVVADIPGLPSWRGLGDSELLSWIEGHYQSVETQFCGYRNFLSVDIGDKSSFDLFIDFLAIPNDIGIKHWPVENASQPRVEFSADVYWIAKGLTDANERLEAERLEKDSALQLVQQLGAELLRCKSDSDTVSSERDSALERLAQAESGLNYQADALGEAQGLLESQSSRLQVMERHLDDLKSACDDLLKQREASDRSADALRAKISQQSELLERSLSDVEAQAVRLVQLEQESAEYRAERDRLLAHCQSAEASSRLLLADLKAQADCVHDLEAELAQSRADIEALRQLLEQQTEALSQSAERLEPVLGLQHELEGLRSECSRRFQWFQLSEEQALTIRALQKRCAELEREHGQLLSRLQQQEADKTLVIRNLESELAEARQAAEVPPPPPPEPNPQDRQRIQQLEQELQEAREEAKLTLEQLFQVQEELERYFLLAEELKRSTEGGNGGFGQESAAAARPEGDAATINSNRARLLASA